LGKYYFYETARIGYVYKNTCNKMQLPDLKIWFKLLGIYIKVDLGK